MKRKPVRPGDRVVIRRTISGADVEAFGELSQDRNPVHFDERYAARTIYGRPIAHGLASAALVSGALTKLMGASNVMLSLNVQFRKPVYVGDDIECELTVTGTDRRRVTAMDVVIRNSAGAVVTDGTVTCMRTSSAT